VLHSPASQSSDKDRLERQLAESQALAHIGSWEWDVVCRQLTWSDEHYRIWGVEPGTKVDMDTVLQRIHPADRARVQRIIDTSLQDGRPYRMEFRVCRPDGSERIVEARAQTELDAGGRPVRNYGTAQDITERTYFAAALERVEERYREAVENAAEGVFRTTRDGRYVVANRALARLLGYDTPEQLMAERTDLARDHYVDPRERARFLRLLETQETVQGFEYEAYRRDGTRIWLREHARVVRDRDGEVHFEGTVQDVSDHRLAKDLRDQLMARAISAQEEERARVARELHDETGQALSAILLGLRNVQDAPTRETARAICERLRDLTADAIRNVGRIARGLRPSALDDLGLVPALRRYADELEGARGVEITITDDGTTRLPADVETTLYRILQEALTNVARHAKARRALVLIERRESLVRATVRDDGRGFDPAAVRRAAPRHRLGLIGIEERATLLGGSVRIASHPGAGVTLIVDLPIHNGH